MNDHNPFAKGRTMKFNFGGEPGKEFLVDDKASPGVYQITANQLVVGTGPSTNSSRTSKTNAAKPEFMARVTAIGNFQVVTNCNPSEAIPECRPMASEPKSKKGKDKKGKKDADEDPDDGDADSDETDAPPAKKSKDKAKPKGKTDDDGDDEADEGATPSKKGKAAAKTEEKKASKAESKKTDKKADKADTKLAKGKKADTGRKSKDSKPQRIRE